MNWNNWIRQIHRWLSIAFTVTVIANFVAMAQGGRASRLGDLLAAAPARLAPVHRSLLVRAAVCHQVAQQATHRLNVRTGRPINELLSARNSRQRCNHHEKERSDQG